MEDRLQSIFANVNDWLKFAESKNATLVAANVAANFAAMQILTGDKELHWWAKLYVYDFMAFAGISALVALVSFLPEINLLPLQKLEPLAEGDNLLFFGHINKYSPDRYLEELYRRSNVCPDSLSSIELDYANQIIVNSRITLRKYQFFKLAMWLSVCAAATPVGALIACLTLNWLKGRNPSSASPSITVSPPGP